MKKLWICAFVLCTAMGCVTSSSRDRVLLEGVTKLAQEDAYKSRILLGTPVEDGMLDWWIKKNPDNKDLLVLRMALYASSQRACEIARQMIDLIESSPALTDEQKVSMMQTLSDVINILNKQ